MLIIQAASAAVRRLCAHFAGVALLAALLALPGLALAQSSFVETVTGSSTFNNATDPLAGVAGCALQVGVHAYSARTITVPSTDLYTFTLSAFTGLGSDPFAAIYSGPFDPANPTANLVGCNDDTNPGVIRTPTLAVNLTAGQPYTLVTTHWNTGTFAGTATYAIAPSLTLVGPPTVNATVSNVFATNAFFSTTSSATGRLYTVMLPAADAAPSAAQVRARTDANGNFAGYSDDLPITAGTAVTFGYGGLQPLTSYVFYAVVEDQQVPAQLSLLATAPFTTRNTLPDAPTAAVATRGNAQASVAFTAPGWTGGSPITQYTVTSSPGNVVATGTTSPVVVTGLTNGQAYTFTVVATNANGDSVPSAPSNEVTPITVPDAPVIGTATAGNGEATLSFTPSVGDGGSAITGYTVTAMPGSLSLATAGSPVTFTGLANGTSYTFTVVANNAAGASVASAASNAVVPQGAPTITGFGDITLTWGAPGFTLSPPASDSAGAFTYASSNPAVATVSGNVVTLVAIGSTTLTATQASDGAYTGGTVTATLVVQPAVPTLTNFNAVTKVFGDPAFALAPPTSPSAGAFSYAISDAAVATVAGDVVTVVGAGTATITVTQAADGNYLAGSATATLVVSKRAPALSGFADISKVYGEAAFDLVDPASDSGGAFTFAISNAAVATVSGRTVTLVGDGVATITATQAETANYSAGSITATLTVSGRPDPTQDREVVAGIQAQVDASVRFVQAQQGNIRDRLRQRRSGEGQANGLSLGMANGSGAMSLQPALLNADEGDGNLGRWSLWTGGVISLGDRDSDARREGITFDSQGITLGADVQLTDQLLVGVATGLGWMDTDIGHDGSRLDGDHRATTGYALWRMDDRWYVDALAGTGKVEFDIRRWSEVAGATATATREGDQRFGSLSLGYVHTADDFTLTTYGRADHSRTTLDAYRESGLGIYDLSYGEQDVEQTTMAIGIEGSSAVDASYGRVRPYWNLEYRGDVGKRSEVDINYVVLPSATDYHLSLPTAYASSWLVGAGVDAQFGQGWTLSLLWRHEVNLGSGSTDNFGLQLGYDWGGAAQ